MAIKGHPKFGATGDFPKGKLNESDEGGLTFAVARDGDNVRVEFGTPVAWMAMPVDVAVAFAKVLLDSAGVTYQIE